MITFLAEFIVYLALAFRGRRERVRAHLRGRLAALASLPTSEDMEVELDVAKALERAERWGIAEGKVAHVLAPKGAPL